MNKISLTSIAALALLISCTQQTSQINSCEIDPGATAAVVNGEIITMQDVDAEAGPQLKKIDRQILDLRIDTLDNLIDQKLIEAEAKKQGLTVDQLILNARKSAPAPTDAEIEQFYNQNKQGIGERTLDEVRPLIQRQLSMQKQNTVVGKLFADLHKNGNVDIKFKKPLSKITVDDDPVQGPADAPITLIEFSEFQCPYCERARPTIQKILATYPGQIRYAFRDFPLSFHKQARPAAIAANCAHKQNKYWEFNAALFKNRTRLEELQDENFLSLAKEFGLDEEKFTTCLKDPAMGAEISKDQNEASAEGVTGTPAYFINGNFLSGARPFEDFQQIIEKELAKSK